MTKPSLPKGMRDYLPDEMKKRRFLLDRIREVFTRYHYQPIQTPAMENLKTLTEKYGEEGNKLLFRVLRSGNFVSAADQNDWKEGDAAKLGAQIADKGLRYDLTVPLARFVSMHRHALTFPFKRYQVQPVWRADRPQRGRYREFYQFDGDVIGTSSLLHDAEMISIFSDAFSALNLPRVRVLINNRKILLGFAEVIGAGDRFTEFCAIIDKVDKIGIDGVTGELQKAGFSMEQIEKIIFLLTDIPEADEDNSGMIKRIRQMSEGNALAAEGLDALEEVLKLSGSAGVHPDMDVVFSPSLARGLDYYTGTIYEVVHKDVKMGSIAGGGRYDDLTSTFGLKEMPGIGISFGIERIYDIMEELKLFPETDDQIKVLAINFGKDSEPAIFKLSKELRDHGLTVDIYPEEAKMKKQFQYADKAGFTHAIMLGTEEIEKESCTIKNLKTGTQVTVKQDEVAGKIA